MARPLALPLVGLAALAGVAFWLGRATSPRPESPPTANRLVPFDGILETADVAFLERFRGPLLDAEPDDRIWLDREMIRAALEDEYTEHEAEVGARFPALNDRDRLIAYLMIRVHVSVDTYRSAFGVTPVLGELMCATIADCNVFAIRMAVALDCFGIETNLATIFSPGIPGHVVVNARDPETGRGWLIDANNNIALISDRGEGGFLERLIGRSPEENAARWDSGDIRIVHPPMLIPFVSANPDQVMKAPLFTPETIAAAARGLGPRYRAYFTEELSFVRRALQLYPLSRGPRTLAEQASLSLSRPACHPARSRSGSSSSDTRSTRCRWRGRRA
ncbi:MAG: hypothetical protein AAFU70_01200 [Planctomycetota bacterium]